MTDNNEHKTRPAPNQYRVRKFYRSLHKMAELPRMLSEEIDAGVKYMESMSMLFEHFPASVVYLDRQPHTLTLNAWLREDH